MDSRAKPCKSCKAMIVYLETDAGRTMPVNADTVEPTHAKFDAKVHVTHFATCPNAKKHRRRR